MSLLQRSVLKDFTSKLSDDRLVSRRSQFVRVFCVFLLSYTSVFLLNSYR
ncbi:hypothetical protein CKA32_005003 [Geitlerinema sp. FC II]|nr:hypothetical protein CKA32_005003 [Geitlerinema sp. FC II]